MIACAVWLGRDVETCARGVACRCEGGNAMRERPILMSAPMVRAILDGTKTQTRRKVAFPRKRDSFVLQDDGNGWWPYQSDDGESSVCNDGCEHPYACPYGIVGDRLWVRETCALNSHGERAYYRADCQQRGKDWILPMGEGAEICIGRWTPAIHMPRWASRITLEITDVRVERLCEISEADALAEGVIGIYAHARTNPCGAYHALWESINGPGSWDVNPFVWVIVFRRIGL